MKFLKIKNYKYLLFLYIFTGISNLLNNSFADSQLDKVIENKLKHSKSSVKTPSLYASINWEKLEKGNTISSEKILWQKFEENNIDYNYENTLEKQIFSKKIINSLNRSIVFNNSIIGPDISWIVPPGLKWNNKYKFDSSVRGYSRRKKDQSFWGFNGGDAVAQFYYQFMHKKNMSSGVNLGVRSINSKEAGSYGTPFGEGLSAGFRIDKQLSNTSGIALGGEQILHFDGLTDTGRDFYFTASKGWWDSNIDGNFPLTIATAGLATGKMAEGTIKGLCSNLFGGSGTEILHQRKLCWAPVFSISRVFNQKFSTFFEYNSYNFLIGSSLAPSKKIPVRGTFALILSDHIDNYKFHSFDEMTWVFRISSSF